MPKPYLISYDIADPRRLRRLHRALKRQAFALQYSVFHAELTEAGLKAVVETIERIIDARKDDVRIYPLPRNGWARACGRDVLPPGVSCTGLPLLLRAGTQESDLERSHDDPREEQHDQPPAGGPPAAGARKPSPSAARSREARRIMAVQQTGQRRGLLLLR